jgi:hypothetical protein
MPRSMSTSVSRSIFLATTAVVATAAFGGSPETIYGLATNGHLVTINAAAPANVTDLALISGVPAGSEMFGIDFRPGTNTLYGVAANAATGAGNLYTINPVTGVATVVPGNLTFDTNSPSTNFQVGFDFHPSGSYADIVTGGGANYRLTFAPATLVPQTSLGFVAGDSNVGDVPSTTRIAHTNANPSQAYGYDYQNDVIVRIGDADNTASGLLTTVGASGVTARASGIGFEFSNLSGTDIGYMTLSTGVPNTNPEQFIRQLYTLNPTTGAVTLIGPVGTNLDPAGLSIGSLTANVSATTPEPASLVVIIGGALLTRHRRA